MDSQPFRAKVLVVDDNAENRALARATLEDEGFDVIAAENGEQGIKAFQSEQPDCVLLDVRMPGLDGFATCARIRALPGGADTPVLFLTALRDVDTFDKALRSGGDDFLTKPVRPAELVVRVQTCLKLRRMSVELREHYELVRHQRDDLMRLQLQKERLTALLVHDLKNPLNGIDLHAQILLRDGELPNRLRPSVNSIREGSRSLLRLILNLLDISKSEEGQLIPKYSDIRIALLLDEVVDAQEVRAKAAGVTLTKAVSIDHVQADQDLLRRVIENLLDNAIRHAPENSAVHVSANRVGDDLEIRVSDCGSGVPPELREKIFERFVQLESGERAPSRSGRGLGLSFCKLAAAAHGGSIWAEPGNPGTVFCVRLPCVQR